MVPVILSALSVLTLHLAAPSATATYKPAPTRVLVKNVAWEASETSLLNLFAQFGDIEAVHLAKAKKRSHARPHLGWAHVVFADASAAARAVDSTRHVSLYSRRLRLMLADVHAKPPKSEVVNPKAQKSEVVNPKEQKSEVVNEESFDEDTHTYAESALAETVDDAAVRSSVLRRLETLTDAEEVERCVHELGLLPGRMKAAEYHAVKAAWKRSVVAHVKRRQNEAHVVDGITAKHYVEGGFGI